MYCRGLNGLPSGRLEEAESENGRGGGLDAVGDPGGLAIGLAVAGLGSK